MEIQTISVNFNECNEEEIVLLGNTLKNMRVNKGFSQQELSDRILKDRTGISKYESGETVPTIHVLNDIAKSLGYNMKIVFENESIPSEKIVKKEPDKEMVREILGRRGKYFNEFEITNIRQYIEIYLHFGSIQDYLDCLSTSVLDRIHYHYRYDRFLDLFKMAILELRDAYKLSRGDLLAVIEYCYTEEKDSRIVKKLRGTDESDSDCVEFKKLYTKMKTIEKISKLGLNDESTLDKRCKEPIKDIVFILKIEEIIKMILCKSVFEKMDVLGIMEIESWNCIIFKDIVLLLLNNCVYCTGEKDDSDMKKEYISRIVNVINQAIAKEKIRFIPKGCIMDWITG